MGDGVHGYEGVTLACDDDKQIQGTYGVMWGVLWTITIELLLLVMTINRFRDDLGDGVHGREGATLAGDDNIQVQPELVR